MERAPKITAAVNALAMATTKTTLATIANSNKKIKKQRREKRVYSGRAPPMAANLPAKTNNAAAKVHVSVQSAATTRKMKLPKDLKIVVGEEEDYIDDDEDVSLDESDSEILYEDEDDEDEDDIEMDDEDEDEVEDDEEATLLISSDEEAVLETQRISLPELICKKLLETTKTTAVLTKPTTDNEIDASDQTDQNKEAEQQYLSPATIKAMEMPTPLLQPKEEKIDDAYEREETSNVIWPLPLLVPKIETAASDNENENVAQSTPVKNKKPRSRSGKPKLTEANEQEITSQMAIVTADSTVSPHNKPAAVLGRISYAASERTLRYQCTLCGVLFFKEITAYTQHLRTVHQLLKEVENEQTFMVVIPPRKDSTPTTMQSSLTETADEQLNSQKENLQEAPAPTPPEREAYYACGRITFGNNDTVALFLNCKFCDEKHAQEEPFKKHLLRSHSTLIRATILQVLTPNEVINNMVSGQQSTIQPQQQQDVQTTNEEMSINAHIDSADTVSKAVTTTASPPLVASKPETPPPEKEEDQHGIKVSEHKSISSKLLLMEEPTVLVSEIDKKETPGEVIATVEASTPHTKNPKAQHSHESEGGNILLNGKSEITQPRATRSRCQADDQRNFSSKKQLPDMPGAAGIIKNDRKQSAKSKNEDEKEKLPDKVTEANIDTTNTPGIKNMQTTISETDEKEKKSEDAGYNEASKVLENDKDKLQKEPLEIQKNKKTSKKPEIAMGRNEFAQRTTRLAARSRPSSPQLSEKSTTSDDISRIPRRRLKQTTLTLTLKNKEPSPVLTLEKKSEHERAERVELKRGESKQQNKLSKQPTTRTRGKEKLKQNKTEESEEKKKEPIKSEITVVEIQSEIKVMASSNNREKECERRNKAKERHIGLKRSNSKDPKTVKEKADKESILKNFEDKVQHLIKIRTKNIEKEPAQIDEISEREKKARTTTKAVGKAGGNNNKNVKETEVLNKQEMGAKEKASAENGKESRSKNKSENNPQDTSSNKNDNNKTESSKREQFNKKDIEAKKDKETKTKEQTNKPRQGSYEVKESTDKHTELIRVSIKTTTKPTQKTDSNKAARKRRNGNNVDSKFAPKRKVIKKEITRSEDNSTIPDAAEQGVAATNFNVPQSLHYEIINDSSAFAMINDAASHNLQTAQFGMLPVENTAVVESSEYSIMTGVKLPSSTTLTSTTAATTSIHSSVEEVEISDDEDHVSEAKTSSAEVNALKQKSKRQKQTGVNVPPVGKLQATHICDICFKVFKKSSRLADHIRLHTGEKPFQCDQCDKAFRIKMRLTEHKMRHRPVKQFECGICGFALATKQDLAQHMRHHSDERPHACTDCPKAFIRASDLKIHMRIHTGERPYVCEVCNATFRANQNLNVHRKTHLGDKKYKCEHCDKHFLRIVDCRIHMRSHTGERPYKCEICGRGFSSKFNARNHIQRQHGVKQKNDKNKLPKTTMKAELARQKELIDELRNQLSQRIKTEATKTTKDQQPPKKQQKTQKYQQQQQRLQKPPPLPSMQQPPAPTSALQAIGASNLLREQQPETILPDCENDTTLGYAISQMPPLPLFGMPAAVNLPFSSISNLSSSSSSPFSSTSLLSPQCEQHQQLLTMPLSSVQLSTNNPLQLQSQPSTDISLLAVVTTSAQPHIVGGPNPAALPIIDSLTAASSSSSSNSGKS